MIKKKKAKQHVRSYLETSHLRRKRRRKRILARVFFILCIGACITGVIFLLRIQALQVESVEVSGTVQVSPDEIKANVNEAIMASRNLFGAIPPTSVFFVDEESLEKRIAAAFPTIASVEVDSGIGGRIDVAVVERGAVAIWCDAEMAECYQMDDTGYLFRPFVESREGKLIFRGMLSAADGPLIGQRFLSGKEIVVFANAKTTLHEGRKEIDYVQCDSAMLCLIKISGNGVLKVDPGDDLANAFDRLFSALGSPILSKGGFQYIDLRYGNKLFYKLADGSGTGTPTSTDTATDAATATVPAGEGASEIENPEAR